MTTARRPAMLLGMFAGIAVSVVASHGPSLAGKDDARAILERSAAYYTGLQSVSASMVVHMEMPEGMPGIPAMGPERYAIAMARPRSLSLVAVGEPPGPSFIQNDEQAYGEMPLFKRYVKTEAVPFEQMTGEAGTEAMAIPGAHLIIGLVAGSEKNGFAPFAGKAKLLGVEAVSGVNCDHLSLKGPEGRSEVWIARGERPWLMRHRKEAPEAPKMPDMNEGGSMAVAFEPGFDIRFSDWEADPALAGAFEIRPRDGFTQAETLFPPPEEMGVLFGEMGGPDGAHESVGTSAPDVRLQPLGGDAVELSSLKGKVVVLDFWATWCKPCLIELPLVHEVTDARADKGVVFFAVNSGESAKVVKKFLKQWKLDVPLVLDEDSAISSAYGVLGLPHLVVIDAEGTVRNVHMGSEPGSEQRLEAELDALLPE